MKGPASPPQPVPGLRRPASAGIPMVGGIR